MVQLNELLPQPVDVIRLEPEELAGVLMEVIPTVSQQGLFSVGGLAERAYDSNDSVTLAVAEAVSWLITQGLAMHDPRQAASWHRLTRRGSTLKTRVDVETFRKGRALPLELLQPSLADKVHHLFVRGDHDTAVFQAFKEVEVAVRKACGYGNELVGKGLVTKAFNTADGPLSDQNLVASEREAEMALFVGAIGHCKNPTSHREVSLDTQEAARLIVFASHLLAIVEERAAALP